jgi:hypothetical protein
MRPDQAGSESNSRWHTMRVPSRINRSSRDDLNTPRCTAGAAWWQCAAHCNSAATDSDPRGRLGSGRGRNSRCQRRELTPHYPAGPLPVKPAFVVGSGSESDPRLKSGVWLPEFHNSRLNSRHPRIASRGSGFRQGSWPSRVLVAQWAGKDPGPLSPAAQAGLAQLAKRESDSRLAAKSGSD